EPTDPQCYSPCGDRTQLSEDPTLMCVGYPEPLGTSTTGTTGTTTTATTGPTQNTTDSASEDGSFTSDHGDTSTTFGDHCISDEGCSGDAPFCHVPSGECVPCSAMDDPDAACAAADPTAPICATDECVPC